MATLGKKIELYAKANGINNVIFETDVKLRDYGSGSEIFEWNLSIPEPTTEQLNSYETAGNTEETLNNVLSIRKNSYKDFGYQLDLLYHDMTAGKLDATGEWYKHIKATKDANPK